MGRLLLVAAVPAYVLPRRSGTKGAAAIDERIMQTIVEDVSGVAGADGS